MKSAALSCPHVKLGVGLVSCSGSGAISPLLVDTWPTLDEGAIFRDVNLDVSSLPHSWLSRWSASPGNTASIIWVSLHGGYMVHPLVIVTLLGGSLQGGAGILLVVWWVSGAASGPGGNEGIVRVWGDRGGRDRRPCVAGKCLVAAV